MSGIVMVRLLPVDQYALWVLANALLTAAITIADGGVANGVMAEGGKVWTVQARLDGVVAAGLQLRRRAMPWIAAILLPVAALVLHRHGADSLQLALLLVALALCFSASLTSSVLETPLKLRQELGLLQRLQLLGAAARAALVVLSAAVAGLAAPALAAGAAVQQATLWLLRRRVWPDERSSTAADPEARDAIVRTVRYTLPGAHLLQRVGPAHDLAALAFGSTASIAEVGALGRLGAILGVVTATIGLIAAPRFARLPNQRRTLFIAFFGAFALTVALGLLLCGLFWCFPAQALAILGPSYAGLHHEALLMVGGSALGLVAGTLSALLTARALLLRPLVAIPFGLLANLAAMAAFDPSTSSGVLSMSIAVAAFSVLFCLCSGTYLILRSTR